MFRSVPVKLSSPYAPDDCLGRLEAVTSRQGNLWHLDARNGGRPEPLLRGCIDGHRDRRQVGVASFSETLGINSFAAVLYADARSSRDGGTELDGFVGLSGVVTIVLVLVAGIGTLILATMFGVGIAALARGQRLGWAFVLIPAGMFVFVAVFLRSGSNTLVKSRLHLIAQVRSIVDGIEDARSST
jgi:hypothetical protein